MKRPERITKVRKWLLVNVVFFIGFFAPLSLACIAYSLAAIANMRPFAESIASLPTIPFWLNFVPEGKIWNFPFALILMIVLALIAASITSPLHHHRGRLKDEDKQRDMKDL